MLQKTINNPALLSFFAKFWKQFKQKNPIVAAAIFIVCTALITYSTIAPDYGLDLPKWFGTLVTVALLIIQGANGSDTYQYIGDEEEK